MEEPFTVADVARQLGGRVDGDEARVISGIAGIRDAGPEDLTFLSNKRYAADAARTRAAAVLVPEDWDRVCPAALIKVPNPDAAFARIAHRFARVAPPPKPGIHPTAVIGENCVIGDDVSIGACCVVEDGVTLGDRTVLHPQVMVAFECRLGEDCILYPQVSLREFSVLGNRVIIHNGTVIGSDGFGYTVNAEGIRSKIPQVGSVEIDDDVEIGANVAIDRARFGRTRIGKGVKIDNLVQVAHNVVIEDYVVIVAQVAIAGSTTIGSRAILAGQAGIAGHIRIGEGAIIGGQSAVTKDVPPGIFVSGYPAMPHEKSTRLHAHTMRLPALKKLVKELEDRIIRLENPEG